MRRKLGLVLGRFQPLHYGHVHIMERAFSENDEVVICIGSAQKSDPLPIGERHRRLVDQMKALRKTSYKIVDLVDPEPIEIWPTYVKQVCQITDETENTVYRSDRDLTESNLTELQRIGFKVSFIKRISFPYKAPNGVYYQVSSATDIKRIHKELSLESFI